MSKKILLQNITVFFLLLLCIDRQAIASATINFQEVWGRVEQYNPSLMAQCWNVNSSKGKVTQARLLPNPTVGLTVENLGAKEQNGQDAQEVQSTLMLNQPILLGKKYTRRIQLKNAEYQTQKNVYSLAYATLYSEAGQRYVDVLIAQHLLQTMRDSVHLAQLTVQTIEQRNKAGKSSLLELNSAQIALGETQIQLKIATTQLKVARAQLAALWGGCNIEATAQDIGLPHNLLPLSELMQHVAESPGLQVSMAQSAASYNQLLTSQSEAWPDMNVGIGARHFQQTQDNALVAQVSVPLTIFDRNQGNIHASHASYSEKIAAQKATLIMIQNQVYVLYQKTVQAEFEMNMLEQQLIPTASSAFELAKQGYLLGRFSYLDLLNAQQRLIDERRRYWQVHGVRDKNLVELNAMLGLIDR